MNNAVITCPKDLASTGGIVFVSEIEALRAEARRLRGEGVDILIAVGHSGFGEDTEIAREVEGLDVVVGGHTNTLLWNGENPLGEIPAGPYPVEVTQPRNQVNGRPVRNSGSYDMSRHHQKHRGKKNFSTV